MTYADIGTSFYCPIRYKSKIWRTTKLVAGKNGKFIQRQDKQWIRVGIYDIAYLERADSDRECIIRNKKELAQAEERLKLETKTVYNLSKVVFYSSQDLVMGE